MFRTKGRGCLSENLFHGLLGCLPGTGQFPGESVNGNPGASTVNYASAVKKNPKILGVCGMEV